MLNLKRRHEVVWDPKLEPMGHGGFNPENFDVWWRRNDAQLANLHPEIAEQWVYRHWRWSPFRFLRLETVGWRREVWTTKAILGRIYMEFGGPMEPLHDYSVMHESPLGPTATARYWRAGTWNIPILVLETPDGVSGYNGELPDVRFVLVEGSLRLRYLNALAYRGGETGPHTLYVLTIPN